MSRKLVTLFVRILVFLVLFTDISIQTPTLAAGPYTVTADTGVKGVLGKTKSVNVKVENKGDSWIYNVGFELLLDNGLEVNGAGCTVAPTSSAYEAAVPFYKQKVVWSDIRDLAAGEEYNFVISLKMLEKHKNSDGTDIVDNGVNIGDVLNGALTVTSGNVPQNLYDNSVNENFDVTVVPFEVQFSCPTKKIKGAGYTTAPDDDYEPAKYQYTITITNNTVHNSSIDLNATIGNGIQVGNFSVAPTTNSMNPDGTTLVAWDDYTINAGAFATITLNAAIFNKTTLDGVVNSGTVIKDADEFPLAAINSTLAYSGHIEESATDYNGSLNALVKPEDLKIFESVDPTTGIGYGTTITYKLNIITNQYYGATNVVVTDTLKDGLNFASTNTPANFTNTPQVNGDSLLRWDLGSIGEAITTSIEVKATVKNTWTGDAPIVANDTIGNLITVTGQCSFETYSTIPPDASSISFTIDSPTITNMLYKVNGGDPILLPNGLPGVAIGDILEYKLTYNASTLGVKQKGVSITDFFPVGTGYNNQITYYENGIQVGGWTGVTSVVINQTDFKADFNYVDENKKLEAVIKLVVKDVPEIVNGKQEYNMLKAEFVNTAGTVKSLRHDIKLQYNAPQLAISKSADKTTGIVGGETISFFTVTVTNNGETTGYDIEVKDALPAEYTNRVNNALPAGVSFNSDVYTITSIPKGGSVVLKYKADVVSPVGAGRSLNNTASIEKYKKTNGGAIYTDNPKQQATVTMSTVLPTVALDIVDNSRNTLPTPALNKGDWVVYHISITLPANVAMYAGSIENTLPNGQTVAAGNVFSSYDPATNTGNSIAYTNDDNASGNKITISSGDILASVDYYIKASLNTTVSPQNNSGATITWNDKSVGGTSHNVTTNNKSINVSQATLDDYWNTPSRTMAKDSTFRYCLRIYNTGQNTAYNFTPYIDIPPEITAANFTGTLNDPLENPVNTFALNPTSQIVGGNTRYTFSLVPSLTKVDSYYIFFDATLNTILGCEGLVKIRGYTGDYYTTPENVVKLDTDNSPTNIYVSSATILNTISTSDNGGSTTEIRPYDTVTYNIAIKIPNGTKAYQIKLNEVLPAAANFTLLEFIDQNSVSHASVVWPYTIDNGCVTADGADVNYTLQLKFRVRTDGVFGGQNRYTAGDTATLMWNVANNSTPKTAVSPVNVDVVQPSMSITGFLSDKDTFNVQGEPIAFSGGIVNNGEGAANKVKVIATIPDGMIIDEATISPGGAKTDSNHIQWDFASIAKATTQNISFSLKEDGDLATPSNGTVQFDLVEYFSTSDNVNSKRYNGASASVTINQPPLIPDYMKSTQLNTLVSGVAVGNDIDGGVLTYTKTQDSAHGVSIVNADGTWTYTPNNGYSGSDTFKIKVEDGQRGYDISTITINVINPANLPTIPNYTFTIVKNTAKSDKAVAVCPNPVTYALKPASSPTNGGVVVAVDGTWTYTPNNNYIGDDEFKITATDTLSSSVDSTITIHVIENVAPPQSSTPKPKPAILPTPTPEAKKIDSGLVAAKESDGNERKLEDYSKVKVDTLDETGKEVKEVVGKFDKDGSFSVSGLEKEKKYTFNISYELAPGVEIVVGHFKVNVDSKGEMDVKKFLIDPYGTVTDIETGEKVTGAKVELYYADTENNKKNGVKPHTLVELPELPDFPPSNNKNPQLSDENGKYAFMVFPHTDYYVVITGEQYETFKSETISVGTDLVKYDAKIRKAYRDLKVIIEADKMRAMENTIVSYKVRYKNAGKTNVNEAYLQFTAPEGMTVVDSGGGSLTENKVIWKLGKVNKGTQGQKTVKLKIERLKTEEDKQVELEAYIYSSQYLINKQDDISKIGLLAYIDNIVRTHKGYIKGYPDGRFKPGREITRAEVAAIFARILNLKSTVEGVSLYSDVAQTHWAAQYIEAVTRIKLFKGYGSNMFMPDKPITREELATVIGRCLKISSENGLEPFEIHFTDINESWARATIEEAFRYKIVNGYDDGSFRPGSFVNRAEGVKMINRMLYRGPLKGTEGTWPDVSKDNWAFGDIEECTKSHDFVYNRDDSEKAIRIIEEPVW